ncbi:unnamed protein product [Caenorhabditis angaria]|uniref:F-box domain-containing protein n=1 Tax=Caenorhabditis angaria TaxID=860376 RepID=A0A9P1IVZ9_9PELO|nr:unnamed protein product [Caenorhabditis angaria]
MSRTMSFLTSYRNNNNNTIVKKQKPIKCVDELPDAVLKNVFKYCDLVDLSRCSLVNHRFRELIEDMEDSRTEPIRCSQKARIFVCDRRRAILEGVSSYKAVRLPRYDAKGQRILKKRTTSTGTNSSEESSEERVPNKVQNTLPFICEQYADNNQSNWAFQFDFLPWTAKYEIYEIFLRNFCSFFDREQSEMEMNFGNGRTPSPPRSGETRSYDKLPSSQSNMAEPPITSLTHKDIEALKEMSLGRVERLAENMKHLRNVHCVFKDSCCYASRPPVTMFWFLTMMRSQVSRITFDRCQASVPVEAHEVLHLANIHRLTVIQPDSMKPAMVIRPKLLINWLHLAEPLRKKISIHLTGCKEMTPKGLAAFVAAWKARPTPAIFSQISIDGNSYKYNDFVNELELLQHENEREPPISPYSRSFVEENAHAVVLEKVLVIHHSKDYKMMLRFKYCKPSRRMVLTCEVDHIVELQSLSPVSTFSRLSIGGGRSNNGSSSTLNEIRSVPSLYSLSPNNTTMNTEDKRINRTISQTTMRIASQGCRESGSIVSTPSFVNKLIRLLSSSN